MQTALIISTYNWPEALKVCLQSVNNQKRKPEEIIIADDGSTEETKLVIDSFSKTTKIPVKHVWQKDLGLRLSRIRNLVIKATKCDYLIFVDGDIILENTIYHKSIKAKVGLNALNRN